MTPKYGTAHNEFDSLKPVPATSSGIKQLQHLQHHQDLSKPISTPGHANLTAHAEAGQSAPGIVTDNTGVVESWRWKAEFKAIMALALPTIVQTCSQQAMSVTDQIFLGHLGTEELAAAALGNTYSNLMTQCSDLSLLLNSNNTSFRWFFLLGSSTALDTLGSQAVGGGNHAALVTWCFVALIITTLLTMPVMVAQYFGNVAAKYLFGQNAKISALVGTFCRMLIPGMFPLMWGIMFTKYLQVQNTMLAPALLTLATFFINIGLNVLFIHALGFKGAPIATTVSRCIQCVLLALTVLAYETWRPQGRRLALPNSSAAGESGSKLFPSDAAEDGGDSMSRGGRRGNDEGTVNAKGLAEGESTLLLTEAAQGGTRKLQRSGSQLQRLLLRVKERRRWDLREMYAYTCEQTGLAVQPSIMCKYLALAIPGGLMLAFEASSFDLTTAFAGHLGTSAVAAHSSMLMTINLTFVTCPFAVATAASIRVGNLLGAGEHRTARLSGWIAVLIGGSFMAVCSVVILCTRKVLGRVYTDDAEIIRTIAHIAPLAALMQVSDGIMGTSQGVLRGCGRQGLLMLYNFIGFWLCGCALGFLLTFVAKMGLIGLWCGISSGNFVTSCLNVGTLLRVDWEVEKHHAQARLQALDSGERNKPTTTDHDLESQPMLQLTAVAEDISPPSHGHSQASSLQRSLPGTAQQQQQPAAPQAGDAQPAGLVGEA